MDADVLMMGYQVVRSLVGGRTGGLVTFANVSEAYASIQNPCSMQLLVQIQLAQP